MNATALGPIRQLGYVVENLDHAVEAWSSTLAVGPWTIFRNVPLHAVHLGRPSSPVIDVALSFRGNLQIELIQQKNDAPSPYLAYIERGQFGLHHTAFLVDRIGSVVASLQASGLKLLCDMSMASGRYVYFESPVPGERTYLELLEATPTMRTMFEQGIAQTANWDRSGKPTVMDFAARQ